MSTNAVEAGTGPFDPSPAGEATYTVEGSRRIQAIPAEVWGVLEDESRFFELRPDAVDHRDIVRLATGGHACTQEYEIRGRRFVQHCTNLEYVAGWRTVDMIESESGRTRSTLTLTAEGSATYVRIVIEATVTASAGRLQRWAMRQSARRRIDEMLQRLQAMVETPNR